MTPSQTIGPFFNFALTPDDSRSRMTGPGNVAERIRLRCSIVDGDGAPVNDAMIELWQAEVRAFGRMETNQDGLCVFETVRTPYVNVSIFARGLLDRLVTRIYFEGDPANAADPVLALVPEDRRHTLMALRDASDESVWNFDIRLSSDDETVFFEV